MNSNLVGTVSDRRRPHPMWLQGPIVLLLVLALTAALSACGGDAEAGIDSGGEPGDTTSVSGADPDSDTGGDAAGDYQPTESQPDLISARATPVIAVEAIDDDTLAVRYRNSSEPCSLANVTVEETDSAVTVSLETGLHRNAAAMSCIAQVIDYEIRVDLATPLGDREIIFDQA